MSYDKVSLLLPMDGANNGTVFTDWSPVPKTVTVFGGAKTATDASSPYGSSLSLNGSSDYLQTAHSSDLMFPAGTDFCIEATIELDTVAKSFEVANRYHGIDGKSDESRSWIFRWANVTSMLLFHFRDTGGTNYISTVEAPWSPSIATKYRVAVSREGTTYRFFVEGTLLGTVTEAEAINQATSRMDMGFLSVVPNYSDGKMHDLRITTGAAVRTAAYTPETRLIGTLSNAAAGAAKILDKDGSPAIRKVFAVPRSYLGNNAGVARIWSTTSNASGEFEIRAPATECSVVALADEVDVYNDLIARVIPA